MKGYITLDNYSTIDNYIAIENLNYILTNENVEKTVGVGGFTENRELVALYVDDKDLFFLHEYKKIKLDVKNMECSNFYIDKNMTCFEIALSGEVIIKIVREPVVNANMLLVGEDVEEFDILLYFKNNFLENEHLRNEFIQKYK